MALRKSCGSSSSCSSLPQNSTISSSVLFLSSLLVGMAVVGNVMAVNSVSNTGGLTSDVEGAGGGTHVV